MSEHKRTRKGVLWDPEAAQQLMLSLAKARGDGVPDVEPFHLRVFSHAVRHKSSLRSDWGIWPYRCPGKLSGYEVLPLTGGAPDGHQYDYYTSFRFQLHPVVRSRGREVIALPMGNLSNRYLITRMGYFNPFASDYILNAFRYLAHWLRFYAFSRRSLFFPWLFGSLAVMARLFRLKGKLLREPPAHAERLAAIAAEHGMSVEEVAALGKLHEPPITQKWFRIFRELWIDRAIIALVMTGGTIALALVPIPLWIKLMVPLSSFPLLYFIYEWAVRDESVFRIEKEIPERARAVARVLPAKVVTFGHTHVPRLVPLTRTATFVDTGTWAPIPIATGRSELRPGLRNYLIATIDETETRLQFGSWMSDPRPPLDPVAN